MNAMNSSLFFPCSRNFSDFSKDVGSGRGISAFHCPAYAYGYKCVRLHEG